MSFFPQSNRWYRVQHSAYRGSFLYIGAVSLVVMIYSIRVSYGYIARQSQWEGGEGVPFLRQIVSSAFAAATGGGGGGGCNILWAYFKTTATLQRTSPSYQSNVYLEHSRTSVRGELTHSGQCSPRIPGRRSARVWTGPAANTQGINENVEVTGIKTKVTGRGGGAYSTIRHKVT